MPFETVEADHAPRSMTCRPGSIVLALTGEKGERGGSAYLDLRIGDEVATRLGWVAGNEILIKEGFGPDARVVLMEPRGASAMRGRVAVAYNKQGALRLRWPVKALRHHQVRGPASNDLPVFRTFGAQLFLNMPAWFVPIATTEGSPRSPSLPL